MFGEPASLVSGPAKLLDAQDSEQHEDEQQNEEILDKNDAEHRNNLPVPGDEDLFHPGELLDDQQDHVLDVDSDVDDEEIADILDDAKNYEDAQVEDQPEDVQEDLMINNDDDPMNEDMNDGINCGDQAIGGDDDLVEPDLVSEEGVQERSTQSRSAPTRYNPSTGRNYFVDGGKYCDAIKYGSNLTPKAHSNQNMKAKKQIAESYMSYIKGKEIVHNIVTQGVTDDEGLVYSDAEARVLATYIQYAHVNYQLPRALRKFGAEGQRAAKSEVKQLHDRTCFRALAIAELTQKERQRAMEGIMLVTQKRSGKSKGRLAYNGKPTREWVSKEDKSSPTCFTESILLTCGIDAWEQQDIMSIDIPNTFCTD